MQIIFSLTSLQQCTAVTDIYFIISTTVFIKLEVRWAGKREESTFQE